MADEVHASMSNPNGNGERLSLQIGSKRLGMQARDLMPILLLLGGMVAGYLLYDSLKDMILRHERQHEQVITTIQDNRVKILDAIHVWQNLIDTQTDDIRKMLQNHDLNMGREPQDKLPLDFTPSRPPRLEKEQ